MWYSNVYRVISRDCIFFRWFKDVCHSLFRWTVLLIQKPVRTMGSLDTQHSKYFGTDRNRHCMMGHAQLVFILSVPVLFQIMCVLCVP